MRGTSLGALRIAICLVVGGCSEGALRQPSGVAAQGLTVSPQIAVDSNVSYVTTRSVVGRVAMAFNGTDHLSVWQDGRLPAGVYAARIDATGALRDPGGIYVARDGQRPAVASDGTGFLVAWIQGAGALRWSRVDAAGRALDTGGVTHVGTITAEDVAVAWTGSNYVMAWSAPAGSPGQISAARLDASGRLLDATPVVVATGAGARRHPSIAGNTHGSLVAWEDYRAGTSASTVYVARLGLDGVVHDTNGRVASLAASDQVDASVTTDGTSFLVAWHANYGAGSRSPGPYAALIGASGATAAITELWPARGTETAAAPVSAAFAGGRYLVTWIGGPTASSPGASYLLPRVYAVRLDAAGALLDATPRAVIHIDTVTPPDYVNLFRPVVNGHSTGFEFLWERQFGTFTSTTIEGISTALDTTSTGTPTTVETVAVDQHAPSVVTAGGNYVVGWIDNGAMLPQYAVSMRAARLSPAGLVLDAPSRRVMATVVSSPPSDTRNFSMASTGSSSVFSWLMHGFERQVTVPVAADGTPGAEVQTSTGAATRTVLVAARTNALLIWQLSSASGYTAQALRVGLDGRPLDRFPLPLPGFERDIAATSNGTDFLIAGTLFHTPCGASCSNLATVRVSGAGDLLDAAPVYVTAGSDAVTRGRTNPLYEPSAWFNGTQYLLAWRGASLSGSGVELDATRLDATGSAIDARPIVVSDFAGDKNAPSVTWDGAAWVIAWADARGASNNVYAGRVSPAGAALDGAGVPIATGLIHGAEPRVASLGAGRSLVVYTARESAASADRVIARLVSFDDAGVIDAGSVDAATDATRDAPDAAIDAGITDSGALDVPAVDVPIADVPRVDVPVTDVPVADVPVTDVPVVDVARDASVDVASDAIADVARDVPHDTSDAETDAATTDATTDTGPAPAPPDAGGTCDVSPRSSRGNASLASALFFAGFLTRRRNRRNARRAE